MASKKLIQKTAKGILYEFEAFNAHFMVLTRGASERFANRDWTAITIASHERLDLYKKEVRQAVDLAKDLLGDDVQFHLTWRKLKSEFYELIKDRREGPIIETFFNSVMRKMFDTERIDSDIEFIDFDRKVIFSIPEVPIYKRFYLGNDHVNIILHKILKAYDFKFKFKDIEGDVERIGQQILVHLKERFGKVDVDHVDMVRPVFYRNKGAYMVGRMSKGNVHIPIVVSLLQGEDGVSVDTILLTRPEISIVFSFTRSYFFVDCTNPVDLVQFLKPLMNHKKSSELFASLGFDRHAKTVLYKEIFEHLDGTEEQFLFAPGVKGMVMSVFTLRGFSLVFKVIRDKFKPPKNVSRQQVINCYRLVFMHDRVGRLADAQEFEFLRFKKDRFSDEVLDELLNECGNTVHIDGDEVVINHLFTERKMIPLNLYLQVVDEGKAERAVVDYGYAIKELAAVNIFPGDLLLKNFGVTRHGRVIFYDYDELCFLEQVNFRRIPEARNEEQLYSGEAWYTVNDNDVFPEELAAFMVPAGPLRKAFLADHQDLLNVDFWKGMQQVHSDGKMLDFYPYMRETKLGGFSLSIPS
ncbi:MAG: isocitrate dehydrogenase kinase/phosphatase [Granulosicoccus sp.]|jgi:isocitrate dehydrogenase kinase/phosphatase